MASFKPYLISREVKRDQSGDYIIAEFIPLSGTVPASTPAEALAKAQELFPLFPHRLAIGETHAARN